MATGLAGPVSVEYEQGFPDWICWALMFVDLMRRENLPSFVLGQLGCLVLY